MMRDAAQLTVMESIQPRTGSLALERCYPPEQIAETWALSVDVIRRIFENEPDVLVIERPRVYGKRRYRTLRIPESVALRVYHRLAKKGKPTC